MSVLSRDRVLSDFLSQLPYHAVLSARCTDGASIGRRALADIGAKGTPGLARFGYYPTLDADICLCGQMWPLERYPESAEVQAR